MLFKKIAIIGTGNVGTWLFRQLSEQKQITIAHFSGRAMVNLSNNYDLYLFSLKDDCYDEVLSQIPFKLSFAAHTSGSLPQQILEKYSTQYGVVYPCQTLLKEYTEAIEVPICIEGSDEKAAEALFTLGKCISNNVQFMNGEQRATLHLAAIFACNFTNAMYRIAEEILEEKAIPFQTIVPLISHTANKITARSPKETQTGPAQRNDVAIIEKHLKLLQNRESESAIYDMLTHWITTNKENQRG